MKVSPPFGKMVFHSCVVSFLLSIGLCYFASLFPPIAGNCGIWEGNTGDLLSEGINTGGPCHDGKHYTSEEWAELWKKRVWKESPKWVTLSFLAFTPIVFFGLVIFKMGLKKMRMRNANR